MRIYVAGRLEYHLNLTPDQLSDNVDRAIYAGAWLISQGHFPIVPHFSIPMIEILHIRDPKIVIPPSSFWYCHDLQILEACEAILLLIGWEDSYGCNLELDYAVAHNMPVFLESELPDLHEFLILSGLHKDGGHD